MVCNSGVGLTPTLGDTLHHFSAGGLYDGLVLLIDDETESYWDHITGEAVHGPLAGQTLAIWPLEYTTVGSADPELPVVRVPWLSPLALGMRLATRKTGSAGLLPPLFRGTMAPVDARRPELENGLGLLVGGRRIYVPFDAMPLSLTVDERRISIAMTDGIPGARWDDGQRPMQMMTRWYGFSLTFPGCEVVTTSG